MLLYTSLSTAGGPAWAGGRQLIAAAAGILQALLEPSEYEQESVKQARRLMCLSSGVAGCLLSQLSGANDKLLLSAAACLRFMALVPGAAEVLAGGLRSSKLRWAALWVSYTCLQGCLTIYAVDPLWAAEGLLQPA